MTLEKLDFQRDVLDLSHELPVLADFWASWCAPCRMLAPVLENLAGKYAGIWKLVKINTEEHPDLAARYGVRGIPDVKLFINGEVADEFSGALPEYQIELWLKKAIPGRYQREIDLAGEFIKEGKNFMASSLLEGVLQKEPENSRAAALLLRALLFSHPEEALRLSRRLEGESEYVELTDAAGVIGRLLLLRTEELPDGVVRERYAAALRELASQQFDSALAAFIDVLREDRYYDNDGSRKACIAIFRYLGEENDITRKHRKAFDRAF
jgi:putative thioredoxin